MNCRYLTSKPRPEKTNLTVTDTDICLPSVEARTPKLQDTEQSHPHSTGPTGASSTFALRKG
jgi:hypothetical protein